MNDKTIQRVIAAFAVILAVFVYVAVTAVRNINRSIEGSDWVNNTHAAIMALDGINASLQAGDAALRTYLITGEPGDRAACRDAFASMAEHLEVARALKRNEPDAAAQLSSLAEALQNRLDFTGRAIEARQTGGPDALRKVLEDDDGVAAIGEVGRQIERLKDREKNLLTERDRTAFLQAQTTRWTVFGGLLFDFVLLIGVAWLIRDDLKARRRAAAVLEDANRELESRVADRTADLASSNEKLQSEVLERRWANQALEHQLRYNQLIINSITDLVLVVTKALNISRINPAVVHHTGWESQDLINTPLSKVVRLDGPNGAADTAHLNLIAQALKDGRDIQQKLATITDRTGRTTAARFSLFPLRDRDKVVGGVVTMQIVPTAESANR